MNERRPTSDSSQLSSSPEVEPVVADETGQTGRAADDARELAHAPVLSRRPSPTDHSGRKRVRESEHGPSTPKGDSEEAKVIGGLTPLAKKGRVQPDSLGENGTTDQAVVSDSDSLLGDDHDEQPADADADADADVVETTPPPPAGLETSSAPATPFVENSRPLPLKSEGKDTRSIRQRVEALEWDDGHGPQPATEGEDTEIPEADKGAAADDEKDVEIQDAAPAAAEQDEQQPGRDMDIADVASQVAVSAQRLAKEDECKEQQDVEIADVAAAVATTAAKLDRDDEQPMADADQAPKTPAPVETQAKQVLEPAVAAPAVPEQATVDSSPATPQPPAVPSKAVTSFSSFSSAASPFSSFKSTASPFAAIATKPLPPAPAEQKPKTQTSFSIPPIPNAPSSTIAGPSRVLPSAPSPAFGTPKPKAPTPAVSTPFSKPLASAATPVASPFASFATKSGFGAVASSSAAFGSYSAQTASPFAAIQRSASVETEDEPSGRKLGEPVQLDADKPVFTKQEELLTGEEGDDTLHSVKCKLFAMNEGQWVERGTGPLKLNVSRDTSHNVARLVMRADATHRLLLNATLFSAFQMDIFQDKYVRFAIIEASGPVSYMLRMSGAPAAQALVQVVSGRVKQL